MENLILCAIISLIVSIIVCYVFLRYVLHYINLEVSKHFTLDYNFQKVSESDVVNIDIDKVYERLANSLVHSKEDWKLEQSYYGNNLTLTSKISKDLRITLDTERNSINMHFLTGCFTDFTQEQKQNIWDTWNLDTQIKMVDKPDPIVQMKYLVKTKFNE